MIYQWLCLFPFVEDVDVHLFKAPIDPGTSDQVSGDLGHHSVFMAFHFLQISILSLIHEASVHKKNILKSLE